MAGRGPAPKPASTRARRNAQPTNERVMHVLKQDAPALEDLLGETNPGTGNPWSRPTLELWAEAKTYPATSDWTRVQWHLLARAMILDDAFVSGELKYETSLRQWIAQFPAFPTDLLRHRITMVMADEAEASAGKTKAPAKKKPGKKRPDPRAHLSSVS